MAMNAGSVVGGGAGSGLAAEMYAIMITKFNTAGLGSAVAQQQIADLCNAIAQAIVPHITGNAEVTQPVGPLDAALQVSTTPGSPTAPNPALPPGGQPLTLKGTVA